MEGNHHSKEAMSREAGRSFRESSRRNAGTHTLRPIVYTARQTPSTPVAKGPGVRPKACKHLYEPHIQPSSTRNGYAVVARGAARLRGVSKDGPGALVADPRDAAKRPLLRMRVVLGWQICAWP